MTKLVWGAAAAALVAATPALGGDASQSTFGKLPDGRSVPGVTLTNGNGISATIIALGERLQWVVMPDSDGKEAEGGKIGVEGKRVSVSVDTGASSVDKKKQQNKEKGREPK